MAGKADEIGQLGESAGHHGIKLPARDIFDPSAND
jgi:hypothetical protein